MARDLAQALYTERITIYDGVLSLSLALLLYVALYRRRGKTERQREREVGIISRAMNKLSAVCTYYHYQYIYSADSTSPVQFSLWF